MKQETVLLALLELLEKNGVDYFVTGSFASSLHGVPRMTQDADVVVRASLKQLLELSRQISDDFYVSEEAIHEAVEKERMFNIIHFREGFKFDLIPLKRNMFEQTQFDRRIGVKWEGKKIYFSSAEDIILAKLKWSVESDSDRQRRDAGGIIEVQGEKLDWKYLESWAAKLKLGPLLKKIKKRAEMAEGFLPRS